MAFMGTLIFRGNNKNTLLCRSKNTRDLQYYLVINRYIFSPDSSINYMTFF